MDLRLIPARLSGCLDVPSSKSMSHRMVIGGALAGIQTGEESIVENLSLSEDISATLKAVEALGARWTLAGDRAVLGGGYAGAENPLLDCSESGSTLRFLIPVALALKGEASFTGRGRLMERPLTPYFQLFEQKGIRYSWTGAVLTASGALTGGTFQLSGAVSSQFVTGLLFALPLLEGESEILITDRLSSRSYVDMTLQALGAFGITIQNDGYRRFRIPGGQQYRARKLKVEGDYSQAAFFLAANSIGSSVELRGLDPNSLQGDRAAAEILGRYPQPGRLLVDADEIPDLIPALAAAAAFRPGEETRFVNAGRLRAKESDRIASTVAMLRALGARAEEGPEEIAVFGSEALAGDAAPVDCQNDHRIAMAAAAASVGCQRPVRLLGAECVKKSYPRFWQDFCALGGRAEEI